MAAEGLGELVDVTSEPVLKPFVVKMTGERLGLAPLCLCFASQTPQVRFAQSRHLRSMDCNKSNFCMPLCRRSMLHCRMFPMMFDPATESSPPLQTTAKNPHTLVCPLWPS